MSPEQIKLVQSTFADVRPIAASAAEAFYNRLFSLDPALRTMFKGDIEVQGRMLMAVLDSAVKGLSDLDSMLPVVRQLGARHVKYGVLDEHYDTVGSALLWTLEKGLGDKFTPQVKKAWTTAYELLATAMQMGAFKARTRQLQPIDN